jgi:hypothetical protein
MPDPYYGAGAVVTVTTLVEAANFAAGVVEATQALDAVRAEVADELEAAGSLLCDCDGAGPATCPDDRSKRLAHHCDCAAVYASRTIRRGLTHTRHALECGHPQRLEEDRG